MPNMESRLTRFEVGDAGIGAVEKHSLVPPLSSMRVPSDQPARPCAGRGGRKQIGMASAGQRGGSSIAATPAAIAVPPLPPARVEARSLDGLHRLDRCYNRARRPGRSVINRSSQADLVEDPGHARIGLSPGDQGAPLVSGQLGLAKDASRIARSTMSASSLATMPFLFSTETSRTSTSSPASSPAASIWRQARWRALTPLRLMPRWVRHRPLRLLLDRTSDAGAHSLGHRCQTASISSSRSRAISARSASGNVFGQGCRSDQAWSARAAAKPRYPSVGRQFAAIR